MFDLIAIISTIFSIKEIINEKTEPVTPKCVRFDWDAYWNDVRNGMSTTEQIKKRERGGYMTVKPEPPKWYELPIDTIIDIDQYKQDKESWGVEYAEYRRNKGAYRVISKKKNRKNPS